MSLYIRTRKREVAKELFRHALKCRSGKILEIGVGQGETLKDYAPTAEVFAIDIRQIWGKRLRPRNVHYSVGLAESLSFADSMFSTVVSRFLLCSVHQWAKCLAEMARVLIPGGHLVIFEHVKPSGLLLSTIHDIYSVVWHDLLGYCRANQKDPTNELIKLGIQIESKLMVGIVNPWVFIDGAYYP